MKINVRYVTITLFLIKCKEEIMEGKLIINTIMVFILKDNFRNL